MTPPPPPPKGPPRRVEYRGMLSCFFGNSDDYEVWRNTPRQKLLARLEPFAAIVVPAVCLILLFTIAVLSRGTL